MARPKIAVFSGPTSTIANSPSLVTSNKGRAGGDRTLPGRFDPLVAQYYYELGKAVERKDKAEGERLQKLAAEVDPRVADTFFNFDFWESD